MNYVEHNTLFAHLCGAFGRHLFIWMRANVFCFNHVEAVYSIRNRNPLGTCDFF